MPLTTTASNQQVFLVLSGKGSMELDGQPTGTLLPGTAIHMPPGVVHSGQALPSPSGESFRMAYFAILDSSAASVDAAEGAAEKGTTK